MPYKIPDGAFKAYTEGKMDPDDVKLLEADIASGEAIGPVAQIDTSAPINDGSYEVPEGAAIAYRTGKMSPEDKAMLEADIDSGKAKMNTSEKQMPQGMSLMDKGIDLVTGGARVNPMTEAARTWEDMPEFSEFWSVPTFKAALGTMFTGAEEEAQVIAANAGIDLKDPTQAHKDAQGNWFFKSPKSGEWFAQKPGMRMTDVPGIVGAGAIGAMVAPASGLGALSTIGRVAGAEALTQAGIEGTQVATGGTFDPKDIAIAGVTGGLMTGAIIGGGKLANAVSGGMDALATPQGARQTISDAAISSLDESPVPASAANVPSDIPQGSKLELGDASRKAIKGDNSELLELVAPNKEAIEAAKALGYEDYIQPDHVSSNFAFKQMAQLKKSRLGGAPRDAEQAGLKKIGEDVERMIKDFGGNEDLGGFSDSVKNSMQTNVDKLTKVSEKEYKALREAISDKAEVEAPNTLNYLEKKAESLGGVDALSPLERRVFKSLSPKGDVEEVLGTSGLMEKRVRNAKKPTYGMMDELRKDVGDIMKPSPIADREQGKAKKLYAELSKDQEAMAKKYDADKLWSEAKATVEFRKGIEKDMMALFGKKFDQSFVNKLMGAKTDLGKADGQKMANLMNSIPKEYRREFTATALLQSMGKATENGKLNFKSFPDWYEKFSSSEQAKNAFFANLPEAREPMDHVAKLSRSIDDAIRKYTGTGASLQQYYQKPEGLIRGVLGVVSEAVPVAVGSVAAGPTGAIVGAIAQGVYKRAKGARTPIEDAATELIFSNDFRRSLIDSISEPVKEVAKKLSITAPFRKFAKAAKLPTERKALESWITSSLSRESAKE
jgi:hypothetical protein